MTQNAKIPFVDLVALHREIELELLDVCQRAIESAAFIGGPAVEGFERAFAEFCGTKYCVGVNSGTDALRFALMAAGIRQGDIVVTVPHTFIATTEAISQAGARPAFVDIDERTYNMDPTKLREFLERECHFDQGTQKLYYRASGAPVTAIVPVHLYGQTADMDPILELARRYRLAVVEDACQAHGAEYFSKNENRWRKAGSIGCAAAFSFYPGKNLGACGEAGAVTTDDEQMATTMRMLRDHGQSKKYHHDLEGYNGRLDSMQAGFLTVKLRHLVEWNGKRCEAARRYDELLSSAPENVIVPYQPEWARSVYHLYVIRARDREGLRTHLSNRQIDTGIHYPIPLHLQKAYQGFGYKKSDFPVTERIASEILSLPMCPHIEPEQQQRVAQHVLEFTSRQPARDLRPAALSVS